MTANLVATPARPDAVQVLSGTKERKLSLRERLQKLLRKMFEGHEELLGAHTRLVVRAAVHAGVVHSDR